MSDPSSRSSASSGGTAGRGRGRELALWILCHLEAHPADERAAALALFWAEPPAIELDDPFLTPALARELGSLVADEPVHRFATRLVDRWLARADHWDGLIEAQSQRWRLARMDRVDRNVLRLVALELAGESTPRAVVVAEAVRLAARYGSERSPAFVNGVAEALAKRLRDESPSVEPS
ncbi:transcription antitermination protein NusB [Nannocystaceae bacterium ST9]